MQELVLSHYNDYDEHIDQERFGPRPYVKPPYMLNDIRMAMARRLVPMHEIVTRDYLIPSLGEIDAFEGLLGRLASFYAMLSDEDSKDLLVKIMAQRILGQRRVKLPLNNPEYWRGRQSVYDLLMNDDFIKVEFMNWKLLHFQLSRIGYDIEMYMIPLAIYNRFILKSYEYIKEHKHIKVEPGDVVLDLGGCWGDTSLYFSHDSGTNGMVYTFEFIPRNLEILKKNLSLNPELEKRVKVVERPVWKHSNKELFFIDKGPGSKVEEVKISDDYLPTSTISIDDFVAEQGLEKVDLIKMDIEGAEPPALEGARETILKHKPKLAISLYHNLSDFVTIPEFIESLDAGYEYYMEHFTVHREETVLFAVSKDS
jgi:FkbM family methyltransferase